MLRDCSPVALVACVRSSSSQRSDGLAPHLVALSPQVLCSRSSVVSKKITEPAFAHVYSSFMPFTTFAFPYYRHNLHYLTSCARKVHITASIRQFSYLQLVKDSLSPNGKIGDKGVILAVLLLLDSETLLCFVVVVDRLYGL